MHVLHRLWSEEEGFIASVDFTLFSTIALIGTIVGAVAYRDALVQELGDLGLAIGFLDQGYIFTGATVGAFGGASSFFFDRPDDCNGAADPAGSPPACIDVSRPAATNG